MGRPKGSKNKVESVHETDIKGEMIENEERKEEKREEVLNKEAPKLEPLGPGQAYFEAPDGTIVIGEDTRNEIWHRAGNNGKGCWINRKRERG